MNLTIPTNASKLIDSGSNLVRSLPTNASAPQQFEQTLRELVDQAFQQSPTRRDDRARGKESGFNDNDETRSSREVSRSRESDQREDDPSARVERSESRGASEAESGDAQREAEKSEDGAKEPDAMQPSGKGDENQDVEGQSAEDEQLSEQNAKSEEDGESRLVQQLATSEANLANAALAQAGAAESEQQAQVKQTTGSGEAAKQQQAEAAKVAAVANAKSQAAPKVAQQQTAAPDTAAVQLSSDAAADANTTASTGEQETTSQQDGEQNAAANNAAKQSGGAKPVHGFSITNATPTVEAPPTTSPADSPVARITPSPTGAVAQPQATAETGNLARAESDTGNDPVNAARLARGLQNAVQQKGGGVTLRLTPPELGTVRIQLNIQSTNVQVQFHAETDTARGLLQQQLSHLRQALESQGLNVERVGIQSMSASSSNAAQSETNGSTADGRSRGMFSQQHSSRQGQNDGDDSGNPQQPSNPFEELMNEAA